VCLIVSLLGKNDLTLVTRHNKLPLMSQKRRAIIHLKERGKSNQEICQLLKINPANLHSTIYQMRRNGMQIPEKRILQLTPTQRQILQRYAQRIPIAEIARQMGIGCQTVQNHASAGFARLGFTQPGIDRIAKLAEYFAKENSPLVAKNATPLGTQTESAPVTMEDPAFN